MRDGLVSQFVAAIARGVLPAGAKLPPESELIQTFGVSRTVVREALKVLEEKGLIDVQHGRGALVLQREGGTRSTRTFSLPTSRGPSRNGC